MRLATSGTVRRVSLERVDDLVHAALGEWEQLRFDPTGHVVDPLTGSPRAGLSLVQGLHRHRGARYRLGTRVGGRVGQAPALLTLVHDDSRRLAFTVAAEPESWSIGVEISKLPPHLSEVSGRVDVTLMLRTARSPGCLTVLLGGRAKGSMRADPDALVQGSGTILSGHARGRAFRVSGVLDVESGRDDWRFSVDLDVRGRGVGRLALLLAGGRLRTQFEEHRDGMWRSLDQHLRRQGGSRALDQAIDDAGGAAAFVRHALWDPSFEPWPPEPD